MPQFSEIEHESTQEKVRTSTYIVGNTVCGVTSPEPLVVCSFVCSYVGVRVPGSRKTLDPP